MNPTKNLIEDKLHMNPTKNLIEPKLYMNTTKIGHHDLSEILLKVVLNTINQIRYASYRTNHKYVLSCNMIDQSRHNLFEM
jgi:hypothetical protein